jgi:hypothetical protein
VHQQVLLYYSYLLVTVDLFVPVDGLPLDFPNQHFYAIILEMLDISTIFIEIHYVISVVYTERILKTNPLTCYFTVIVLLARVIVIINSDIFLLLFTRLCHY